MFVCHCRKVTDQRICAAIEEGAADTDALARRCGAGGGCGTCLPALQALLACFALVDVSTRVPAEGRAA